MSGRHSLISLYRYYLKYAGKKDRTAFPAYIGKCVKGSPYKIVQYFHT